jgi:flagellar basal body rod protein FlgG
VRFGIRQLLLAIGLFAAVLGWWFCPQGAPLRRTGRELDLAIVGPGYFFLLDDQSREAFLTRKGSLIVDESGLLAAGPPSKRIRLHPKLFVPSDAKSLQIDRAGNLRYCRADAPNTFIEVGRIWLCTFVNSAGLYEIEPDLFVATDDSGCQVQTWPTLGGAGHVLQGWLETPATAGDPARAFDLFERGVIAVLAWLVYQFSILRQQVRQ